MFGRDQPEIGHQLARIGEAREVTQFGDQGRGIDQRHAAHRLRRRRHRGQCPPIGLDSVAGAFRDQRRGDHDTFVPAGRQATVNDVTKQPRLVTGPQLHAVAPELALQRIQRCRCVRDPAVLPHLAPQATRRRRDNNVFLVNIKPNVGDTIRHDPSPMHAARYRPDRRNPRYLHTVRRVAPYSGGHVV